MVPRETENNAYAKFWGDKQRALWYVMVCYGMLWYFLEWSIVKLRRSPDFALLLWIHIRSFFTFENIGEFLKV